MRSGFAKLIASMAMLGVGGAAYANSMEITSVPGASMGGEYTGPYTALIGPSGENASQLAANGTQLSVICDDFATHVSIGQVWQTTTATSVASLAGLTSPDMALKFGTTGSAASQQAAYMELAYLADELANVDQSTTAGQTEAGELNYAIWSVEDPASLNNLSNTDFTDAQAYAAAAQLAITKPGFNSPLDYGNVEIYTPSPLSASQEFLTVERNAVPAPANTALLAAGLLGVFALGRRRMMCA